MNFPDKLDNINFIHFKICICLFDYGKPFTSKFPVNGERKQNLNPIKKYTKPITKSDQTQILGLNPFKRYHTMITPKKKD